MSSFRLIGIFLILFISHFLTICWFFYIIMPRHRLLGDGVNWKEIMQVNDFNVNLASRPGIGYPSLQMFLLVIPQSGPRYFTEVVKEEQHVNGTK